MKAVVKLLVFAVFLLGNAVLGKNGFRKDDEIIRRQYYFSEYKDTFFESTAACARMNMTLLKIESEEQQASYEAIMNDLGSHKFFPLWLYGTDAHGESTWRWLPNYEVFDYSNWGEGYPRDWYSQGHLYNCAVIAGELLHYVWKDGVCSLPHHYACYNDYSED